MAGLVAYCLPSTLIVTAFFQLTHGLLIGNPLHLRQVCSLMGKPGVQQLIIELLIIRDDEQTLAVLIETTDWIDCFGEMKKRGKCLPLSAKLAQNPKGLVNDKVSIQN